MKSHGHDIKQEYKTSFLTERFKRLFVLQRISHAFSYAA
jgi:hypothetical protein